PAASAPGPAAAPPESSGAAVELEAPVSGAQGDELGEVAALEGLQATDVGTTQASNAEAPSPAPAAFDLDTLFRDVGGAHAAPAPAAAPAGMPTPAAAATPVAPPAVPTAAPEPAAPTDFANSALDLSDASPFPPAPAAATFVTETMAELYLRQGHREQALEVYRQLLAARPGDASLRARVLELETPPAVPVVESSAPSGGPTIREFLSALATRRPSSGGPAASPDVQRPQTPPQGLEAAPGPASETPRSAQSAATVGGSLDALFGGAERSSESAGASPLELAFLDEIAAPEGVNRRADLSEPQGEGAATDQGSELPGRPTKPAETELSLDHVFRKPTPASGSPAQGGFSFDQFFSQQAQEGGESASAEVARDGHPTDGDDIQQFNAWLEGLKKS
ncbi:MAG TPA: tetratricopeptide repeat protein, partial [Gemmatimonadaceae bacterium]|nr:tetratricopeptide repeat protein [Gemmatimonadaceae bacterium]